MKIICQPDEYAKLIRRCTEALFTEDKPCDVCLLKGFCNYGCRIEDSGILEVVLEEC